MSQPDDDEYNNLVVEETIAIVCVTTIPFVFAIAFCLCTRLCCCLCDLVTSSRNHPQRPRGSNEPPDIGSVGRRRSLGEQPKIWDVSTAPRLPPRSEPGPQLERPGLGQGQGEDERHDMGNAADDREGTEWTEFLVSCACSPINTFRWQFTSSAHACFPGYPATICRQGVGCGYCRSFIPSGQ